VRVIDCDVPGTVAVVLKFDGGIVGCVPLTVAEMAAD